MGQQAAPQTVKLLQSLRGPAVFVCPAVLQEFSEQQSRYNIQYIITDIIKHNQHLLECSFHWTEVDSVDTV